MVMARRSSEAFLWEWRATVESMRECARGRKKRLHTEWFLRSFLRDKQQTD